ncbi:DNA-binding MarR family transcriptional regulator [Mucilaginibacter gracilis]|uniref:DNA-binding MarR family transcriptional regulator n=1 Tax=Mucilaginibacter gracilis TaxID=423350 RepID=A0A495IXC6_9SPHI|nr:MarR family transcriptional regulator [Mucilaginibacter gracilis]RKR81153.1 DNA-binding MarR family transcriptional regulator [Mucilaginibacter gracilis]
MNEQNLALASELRTVIARLTKTMRRKSVWAEKLSLTERSTIASINQNGTVLASKLALMEKITTQSMSQILNHLFELGLITKTPSQTDKRKVLISLSDAGQNLLFKSRSEKEEWLNKVLTEHFTSDERELLSKAIAPLTRLVDFD